MTISQPGTIAELHGLLNTIKIRQEQLTNAINEANIHKVLADIKSNQVQLSNAIDEATFHMSNVEHALSRDHAGNAGQRLVDVAEVLEMILLHLPMRDLLLSQRVSKQFKGVIEGSKGLQQALFFSPDPPEGGNCGVPRINPLLRLRDSYRHIPLFAKRREATSHRYELVFLHGRMEDGMETTWLIACCKYQQGVEIDGTKHTAVLFDVDTDRDNIFCCRQQSCKSGSWNKCTYPNRQSMWSTASREGTPNLDAHQGSSERCSNGALHSK